MALLKYVDLNKNPAGAKNPELISREIHYILNPFKIPHNYWGGYNFILSNVDDVIMQFYAVKNVYKKENYVQLRHFVLSFAPDYDKVDYYQAYSIAYEICGLFYPDYQIIFAVHEDRDYVHIHFLINTIDLYTGKTIHMDKGFYKRLHYKIRIILLCPALWHGRNKVLLRDGIIFD